MKTTIGNLGYRSIGLSIFIMSVLVCNTALAAVGVIDLDIDESASTSFEMFYHDGNELTVTDYEGFQNEKYPLTTAGEYLISDSISIISQQAAGLSFKFNGQGMQTLRLDLLDMNNRVIWTFHDEDLYSGTKASPSGKVPYKRVSCDDIQIKFPEGKIPALVKLRLCAASGLDTYRLHLHALNMYSTPDSWDKCRIELASPVQTDGNRLYLTWISINGASGYNVIVKPDNASVQKSISVSATKHATHHTYIPLEGLSSFTYHIEACLGDHIIKSESWHHTPVSGIDRSDITVSGTQTIPSGIRVISGIAGNVAIYTITGACIASWDADAGESRDVMLPSGIYMIRFPDHTVKAIAGH